MNKSELIQALAERHNLPLIKAEKVVNLIFDQMVEALKNNERIEIRGFGSFENRYYGAYTGRNPKTGEAISVANKRLPFFKVGKELKERVNLGGDAKDAKPRSPVAGSSTVAQIAAGSPDSTEK